jgi:anti-sigma B factor antagonist
MTHLSEHARSALSTASPLQAEVETSVEIDDDGTVVVAGPLDFGSAELVWSAIERSLRPDRPLVVDVAGVTFIDCAGLAVLLRAGQLPENGPRRIVVRSPSAVVRRLVSLADLDGAVTLA